MSTKLQLERIAGQYHVVLYVRQTMGNRWEKAWTFGVYTDPGEAADVLAELSSSAMEY